MNYPLWDLPASGLLIAFVAIVHVFISHFAVGGGLFLVLTERKARREHDEALLTYVKAHTRFFTLLTLVLGAITGVGIWFTIGLVHPAATSTLINAFVWGWAIEWTFFVVEIAAAMVYFYGWDRLSPATHMTVGWIYFWAAWLSLVVINGILTFMLTPGGWIETRGFWDGILNPTYFPAMLARTAGAVGLAGVYALFTAATLNDPALKHRVARYAVLRWIVPMAIVLPITLLWTLDAAAGAGVPVRAILGAAESGVLATLRAVLGGAATGYPIAQIAARVLLIACVAGFLLALVVLSRSTKYGRPLAATLMACAFVALGAAEWLREDLRKPYVIGHYMFVNGVRAGGHPGAPVEDRFTVDALNRSGVLPAASWSRLGYTQPLDPTARAIAEGDEVFRLLCRSCHTTDGYLAIRPLARGNTVASLDAMISRLPAWRGRRMPPFAGTDTERQALAVYLASLGGTPARDLVLNESGGDAGATLFADNCSMCHGVEADFPFAAKGRDAKTFYEMLGRLPQINEAMPAYEGTDAERLALAAHLSTLTAPAKEVAR